jgi:hypothetical protein
MLGSRSRARRVVRRVVLLPFWRGGVGCDLRKVCNFLVDLVFRCVEGDISCTEGDCDGGLAKIVSEKWRHFMVELNIPTLLAPACEAPLLYG